jgi:rubrerythrin
MVLVGQLAATAPTVRLAEILLSTSTHPEGSAMKRARLNEFLLQALEHERGGVEVYQTALKCVRNSDLKEEWKTYLDQTKKHDEILTRLCDAMELDPEEETPGRAIVRGLGKSLVSAMEEALSGGDPHAAELVACDCVTLAETKDHANWELLHKCSTHVTGEQGKLLKAAIEEVEEEEDEHLYHSKGWCRELWINWFGLKAVLPPPEEQHHVKTAIGAARAEQSAPKKR